MTDGDFATLAGTETLTNKTLTSPAINGGVIDATSTTTTAAVGTSSTRLANTAFVQQEKEYLPALSQSLHIGAVVKAIVYDTSKDSDGGAWRKRCADKSWYTETLGGDRWIGQHATISAAWTAAGSTTGAVFLASATAGPIVSGYYYTATSSTTATQVYRGVTREFPAVAGIVAESARVVIYDLSNGAMWMVVSKATGYMVDSVPTSICAQNGQIIIGSTGLFYIALLQDAGFFQNTSNKYKFGPNIAGRNAAGTYAVSSAGIGIVSSTVSDVAITVLDTAPIDAATGLPVPTIYAFTAGGVSRIADDGTVSNTACSVALADGFVDGGYVRGVTGSISSSWPTISALPAGGAAGLDVYWTKSAYYATGVPATLGSVTSGEKGVFGSTLGATLLKENPTTYAKGMVAQITTAYNTGWLPGDIRGAYLADTTAETVTASGELVTNGTFTTDTTGWTASGATLSVVSGAMRVTNSGAAAGYGYQQIATVVGKSYQVQATRTAGTGPATFTVGVSAGSAGYGNITSGSTCFLTATTTTTFISCYVDDTVSSHYADFDNISVKLAEPDRSVKNKGLVINGSLTKTAVASGAGLVAYSGFSGSNYLEQPYNSDLDFGTGDFCVMGWFKTNYITAGYPAFVARNVLGNAETAAGSWGLKADNPSQLVYFYCPGSTTTMSSTAYSLDAWTHVAYFRLSGVGYLYQNGVLVATQANTVNLTLASASTFLGVSMVVSPNSPFGGSMALWRISATAPSADQIAHIYRTELPLFQASAQCTIAGSSTAVTALAFDDTTELLHVGTSWGRTGFKDLLRVDSEATTTGALTSLSASQGVIITGGTSGKVYVPAFLLRDELRRKDEARKALGKVPVSLDFTATASQTAFVLAKGYTAKFVYVNGLLQRLTGQYTVSTDGFQETVTMVTGVPINQYVTVIAVRS